MDVTRAAGLASAEPTASGRAPTGGPPQQFADGVVCASQSPLIEVRRTCMRVAASQATVLLTGETGTGKEVFARLVHTHSPRLKRQFVPVNCGAIPEALLESELFGYVKGAFTGAVHPRRGRVALAEGGTLFLDEIGELPLSLQVKLLRLLQQRTYEPVGSSESVSADFRLVAATNRDLLQEVRAGRFRQDLFYRLNVCPVHLPPLRQRRGDVTALFTHFWSTRGETRPVEPAALQRLEAYDWPGNVRELENLVERVSVIAEGPVIRLQDLPPPLCDDVDFGVTPPPEVTGLLTAPPSDRGAPSVVAPAAIAPFASLPYVSPAPVEPHVSSPPPAASSHPITQPYVPVSAPLATPSPFVDDESMAVLVAPNGAASYPPTASIEAPASERRASEGLHLPVNLPVLLRELEEAYIAKALAQTGGNKKEAARLLGMGRTTLVEKLRRRNSDTPAT